MNPIMRERPTLERWKATGKATGKASKEVNIDPAGGRYGAGIIPAASMCSTGEALGHGQWIDAVMLQQIVDGCNQNTKLLKSRFTHPDMCGDGTGKALGTIENAVLQGDQAVGDLHFYKTAHNAPDGDLAGYVMSLAGEDPENFGMSIVFAHDTEAENQFMLEHGGEWVIHDDGWGTYKTIEGFESPDPLNTENYPHARIAQLFASDVVDDPAANPNGLFHRKTDLFSEGTALLDYATGKVDKPPVVAAFNIAPERIREFLTKYLAASGLTIIKKDKTMPRPKATMWDKLKSFLSEQPADGEDPKDEKPGDQPGDAEPDGEPGESNPDKTPDNADASEDPNKDEEDDPQEEDPKKDEQMSAKLKKFAAKFGAENGSKWTIEGISYETALERHCDLLTAQNADQAARLQALGQSGTDPVKFSHPPAKGASGAGAGGTSSQSANKLQEVCGDGLGKVAAAIKLPVPSSN